MLSATINTITHSFLGTFHFSLDGHGYFYSQYHPDHSEDKEDWLDARNACREYCMDLVSLETPFENDMIEDFLIQRKKKLVVKSAAQGVLAENSRVRKLKLNIYLPKSQRFLVQNIKK